MVRSIVQRDTDIDQGVASQEAFIKRRTHTFLDRRNILARDSTPLNFVRELEPFATRERFDANPRIPKLSTAAALFLQPSLRVSFAGNRFAVRDLGGLEVNVDAEFSFELLDGNFNVELTSTGKQDVIILRVTPNPERQVFFGQLMQRGHDFFFVAARLQPQRKGNR